MTLGVNFSIVIGVRVEAGYDEEEDDEDSYELEEEERAFRAMTKI